MPATFSQKFQKKLHTGTCTCVCVCIVCGQTDTDTGIAFDANTDLDKATWKIERTSAANGKMLTLGEYGQKVYETSLYYFWQHFCEFEINSK